MKSTQSFIMCFMLLLGSLAQGADRVSAQESGLESAWEIIRKRREEINAAAAAAKKEYLSKQNPTHEDAKKYVQVMISKGGKCESLLWRVSGGLGRSIDYKAAAEAWSSEVK